MPVGAVAMLEGDDGVRKFSITGKANAADRTISLDAFEASGDPLHVVVRPGGVDLKFPIWPPMTNVGSSVVVHGATLLLRARRNPEFKGPPLYSASTMTGSLYVVKSISR